MVGAHVESTDGNGQRGRIIAVSAFGLAVKWQEPPSETRVDFCEVRVISDMPVKAGRDICLLLEKTVWEAEQRTVKTVKRTAYILTSQGMESLVRVRDRKEQTSELFRLDDRLKIKGFQTDMEPDGVEAFRCSEVERLQSSLDSNGRLGATKKKIAACDGYVVCESTWAPEVTLEYDDASHPMLRYKLEHDLKSKIKQNKPPTDADQSSASGASTPRGVAGTPRGASFASSRDQGSQAGLVRCFASFECSNCVVHDGDMKYTRSWDSTAAWAKDVKGQLIDPAEIKSRWWRKSAPPAPRQKCKRCQKDCRAVITEKYDPRKHATDGEHEPYLCPVCISLGHWCIDAQRSPEYFDRRLRRAVDPVDRDFKWVASDAGVETKVHVEGSLFTVQLRPHMFCLDARYMKMVQLGNQDETLGHQVFNGCFPVGVDHLKALLVAYNALMHRSASRIVTSDASEEDQASWKMAHTMQGAVADYFLHECERFSIDAVQATVMEHPDGNVRRFPLALGRTRAEDDTWETAFHGTKSLAGANILMDKMLRRPGDGCAKVEHGQAGSATNRTIYVSCSLTYALHPVYSTVFALGENHFAQMALEVRVKPGSYKERNRTTGKSHFDNTLRIDPDYPDGFGLELLVESSSDIELVALIVRELGSGVVDKDLFGALCCSVRAAQTKKTRSQEPSNLAGYDWTDKLEKKRRSDGHFSCRRRAACMLRRRSAAGHWEVVLVELKSGTWALPGGSVDTRVDSMPKTASIPQDNSRCRTIAEWDLNCALRELQEETGVGADKIVVQEGLGCDRLDTATKTRTIYHVADVVQADVAFQPRSSNEIRSCKWFSAPEARQRLSFASDREAIEHIFP